jgi:isopentenyldiphosphate isomerase
MKDKKPNQRHIDELRKLRSKLSYGDNTTQSELDLLHDKFSEYKPLADSAGEIFSLMDSQGKITGLTASRWLCHLLGLRHRSVHVLLQWQSPGMGNVFILQVRSWQKSDSPGCIDISVGGHVTTDIASSRVVDSAYREMKEELGLDRQNLIGKELLFQTGYESYDENESKNFYNAEWRDVYLGRLLTQNFNKLKFSDKEVVGLYLCPESEAKNLLSQTVIPIASALKLSLPFCLHGSSVGIAISENDVV